MTFPPQYDEFVLPDSCGQDDSSSESDSNHDENELMEAAFFAPPSHGKENNNLEVVDLCDSDNEANVVYHQGIARLHPKSPRFNQMERGIGNLNSFEQERFSEAAPQRNDHNDDIVECWSSDEEKRTSSTLRTTIRRGNQVTRAYAPFHGTTDLASMRTGTITGTTSTAKAPIQTHRSWRSEGPDRRRKLRNATNSFLTSSVAPKQGDSSSYNNIQQASTNVWYRNTQSDPPATGNPYVASRPRNDLHGGSGAGLGGFDIHNNNRAAEAANDLSQYEAPERPASWKSAAAKQTSHPRKRASGGKKKSWGKKGGWRKKGGYKYGGRGKASSNSSNSSNSRSRRRSGGDQPYMEISRQDPQLKHVGGANIIF